MECSPLSRWDPFEQRELEVTQAVDEGEFLGVEEKNLKWVVNLMKRFCKIVGFFFLISKKIYIKKNLMKT